MNSESTGAAFAQLNHPDVWQYTTQHDQSFKLSENIHQQNYDSVHDASSHGYADLHLVQEAYNALDGGELEAHHHPVQNMLRRSTHYSALLPPLQTNDITPHYSLAMAETPTSYYSPSSSSLWSPTSSLTSPTEASYYSHNSSTSSLSSFASISHNSGGTESFTDMGMPPYAQEPMAQYAQSQAIYQSTDGGEFGVSPDSVRSYKKPRRRIWHHALESDIFTPHEIATLGAPHRRTIYLASLEAHVDRLHSQLLEVGLFPIHFDKLVPYKGLNCKTAKCMVASLQHDISAVRAQILEVEASIEVARAALEARERQETHMARKFSLG